MQEAVWILTPLALLLLTFAIFGTIAIQLKRSITILVRQSTRTFSRVKTIVATNLRPTIHVHDSPEMVSRRAADLIANAAAEEKPEDRFISYYGAASLSAQKQPTENPADEDGAEKLYTDALEKATRAKVQVRRYISLFSPDELKARSLAIRQQYSRWMKRQQIQLANDELYQLLNVMRGPKWGANMARIITKRAVMEITGNGKAAVIIEDDEAAKTIREYARQAVLGGENRPTVYGLAVGEESIAMFRKKVKEAQSVVDHNNEDPPETDQQDKPQQ